MTSKNSRAPFLYYIKLCASFQIHRWIKTEVTVWIRSSRVKIDNFLARVTLKFDGWPWKTIGHLLYTTSSFVHHFKAMGEFKLELQSGNAQFGSKSVIFCPLWLLRVTIGATWPTGRVGWTRAAPLPIGRLFRPVGDGSEDVRFFNECRWQFGIGKSGGVVT